MISKIMLKLLFLALFFGGFQMSAQETKFEGDPDASFEIARNLAFNQQRKQAQDTLLFILTTYPNYHDIRSFLATTYSWDGDYKKARKEFNYVLEKDIENKTTWIAAIKNELWGDLPFAALEMTNNALKIFPKDTELLYLKASAQENSNNTLEALSTIQLLLDTNPEDQKAKDYKANLNNGLSQNAIGITSSVDLYSDVFDPMQYHALMYRRQTKYGSIIGRVNFNRRFNENGVQYEVDLYPKITKGLYAYVNFGIASTFLFPDIKYGAELFKSLPKSFEISLGFRTLKYNTTTNIYTGSLGWYTGNSYLSFRPYFTPGVTGTSISGTFTYRKYRSDADNYLGVAVSMGFSPEINQFAIDENAAKFVALEAQRINLGYYFTSSNKQNAWGTQLAVTHQEIIFDQGNFFWIYSLVLSWELKFK
ncbi:YaiO family outer membrane beta-barrel protein [Flavobacterium sp. GSP27]|uniref:YaiO family outer membrane beta-barrel protein n=1 Tax=Flavobacterium bomense TaxID=2497483 RepID=A0A432CMP1_9FLAO|nr:MULTISPECIES: YaiO family outer membrane beta-barrel protein [Flavobacterium]RTY94722.1 YaiO family outer membrane beta-barrel protein [Flavobacterium sp. GSN2]RTY67627.1 YaiO family outer membrane beta-barrel protein [Flavobacterium sp. LB2P53]RTY73410.1 YaiO family outer membrane beta-barrel protein [Flavobacterium sp. LS1R10]RTY81517.1 YaiO family outer membrane beta-barrel protein [Flavobacterium sp. ZB4P23]RTY81703.1 YaiO family outer membrane beta-barrel protein [Flavobacterium sp. LS